MAALFIIKFGSDRIKTVVGTVFWNFQIIMVLYMLTQFQSAIKFLIFGKSLKHYNFLFPHD